MAEDRPAADLSNWKIEGAVEYDGILYPPFNPEALKRIEEGELP